MYILLSGTSFAPAEKIDQPDPGSMRGGGLEPKKGRHNFVCNSQKKRFVSRCNASKIDALYRCNSSEIDISLNILFPKCNLFFCVIFSIQLKWNKRLFAHLLDLF